MRQFDTSSYLKMKDEASKSTHVDVTKEEFIKLYVENGGTLADAEMHAKVSKIRGSYVKVGNKMLSVLNN